MKYEDICRLVMNCKKADRVPSVNQLLTDVENRDVLIIYSSSDDPCDGLTIFSNGYVIYGNGVRKTVFAMITFWYKKGVLDPNTRLPRNDYITDASNENIDIYMKPKWQRELIEYGENRLNHNEDSRIEHSESSVENMDEIASSRDIAAEVVDKIFVSELLNHLNNNQRKVIVMYFFEGCSYEEIANRQNSYYKKIGTNKHASKQSVRQMVHRALAKMREIVSEDDIYS